MADLLKDGPILKAVRHLSGGVQNPTVCVPDNRCTNCNVVPEAQGETQLVGCTFCPEWYCISKCAKINKSEMKLLSKQCWLWQCPKCCEKDENKIRNVDSDQSLLLDLQKSISKMSTDMKALSQGIEASKSDNLESLKNLLDSSLKTANSMPINVDPLVVEIVAGVSDAWTQQMTKDGGHSESDTEEVVDNEDFPDAMRTVLSKREKRELSRVQREEKNSIKLVQAALASQKDDEERQKNLIVYRIPETLSSVTEARTKDQEAVKKLLETLDVDSAPVEIRRLGRFDRDHAAERPRPVKIVLMDRTSRDLAMANVTKLAKTSDAGLKALQVCYDLNRDQRDIQKKLVAEGKDLTKNSQTHIWKVRGPPENMQLRKFLKRNLPVVTTPSPHNAQAQTTTETTHP